MNTHGIRLWRVACLSIVFACLGILALQTLQKTNWYRSRLFRQLLHGTSDQRLAAANHLARLEAEDRLLQAIQSPNAEVHELSRRALEQIWFQAAGVEALKLVEQAHLAASAENYAEALDILNRLILRYPRFAEGWNRRASLYWQIGEYERSMADCERALALNPNHYGAWQGLGVCQIQMGKLSDACVSLRAALKIVPHDQPTRDSLRKCEELLHSFPNLPPTAHPSQLL